MSLSAYLFYFSVDDSEVIVHYWKIYLEKNTLQDRCLKSDTVSCLELVLKILVDGQNTSIAIFLLQLQHFELLRFSI